VQSRGLEQFVLPEELFDERDRPNRLYVVSMQMGTEAGGLDGALLVVDGLGLRASG
jgi:hypothetical protein